MVPRDPHFLYSVGRDLVHSLAALYGSSQRDACPACQRILEVPPQRGTDPELLEKLIARSLDVRPLPSSKAECPNSTVFIAAAALIGLLVGLVLGVVLAGPRAGARCAPAS